MTNLLCCMGPSPAGTLGLQSLQRMLQAKQVHHSLLLVALQAGGVLQQLPPPVLATLFLHAQVLAGAAAVLEYQQACEQAAASGESTGGSTCTCGAVCLDRLQHRA